VTDRATRGLCIGSVAAQQTVMLASWAAASAGVDFPVFMNSAIRPGSRSMAANAAMYSGTPPLSALS
jgi:hypothetical protein